MTTLLKRTLSGVIFAAIVIGAVWYSPFTFLLLLAAVCTGCMWEFFRIVESKGVQPQKRYSVFVGLLAIAAAFFIRMMGLPAGAMLTVAPFVFVVFIRELYRKRNNPAGAIASSLMGIVYVAVPLALLCYVAFGHNFEGRGGFIYRREIILSYIAVVWMNDVGAYLTGVTIGRHRLFERISPKKSWEGFFGGLAFAVATAAGAVWLLFPGDPGFFIPAAIIAAAVAVSGVFGDLVESMLKRWVGVKDSGRMMPGHGGFLDRFDAMLLSAPFVAACFAIIEIIGMFERS